MTQRYSPPMAAHASTRASKNNSKTENAFNSFERVMSDERRYDQIEGPNRNKERLEKSIKDAAMRGRKLKISHMKAKNHSYSGFVKQPSVKQVKFDQVVSREQAAKGYLKIPEGAPFWKYNVKDEVITAPVRTHKISENPLEGHC